MRPRTLLVLLAVVLGLGAFIWFYERELPSSEERARLEKRVLRVEKEDVTALTLQSESGTVRLERVGLPAAPTAPKEETGVEGDEITAPETEWRIVEPLQARADTFAVDGLLDGLVTLESSRTIEDVDPKEAGLDQPRATVRLKTAEGEKVLRIGAEVPTGGAALASLEGRDETYVVPDSILTEIGRAPGDWRDRQIYRGERDAVRRITLAANGQRLVLVPQGGEGSAFRIESPVKDQADREKVDSLFAELSGLTAERFVDQPPQPLAELGLQPPRAIVEVAFAQGPPARIELGAPAEPATEEPAPGEPAPAETFWARAGSQLFQVRTRLHEAAARPVAEWRSQSLSSLDVFQVDSLTVQDGQGTLSLQRAEPDWKRGEETISYLPVSDFLFSLTGATAERLLAADDVPLGKPVLTVTLKPREGAQEVLTLYPQVAAGVPARASGRDLVLLLPAGTLQEIQAKLAEVRKAKPVEKQ